MSFKARLFRFTRTAYVMDLRDDAQTQQLAAIKRKALAHMMRNKMFGRAVFPTGEVAA